MMVSPEIYLSCLVVVTVISVFTDTADSEDPAKVNIQLAPKNAVVISGRQMRFRCSKEKNPKLLVDWKHRRVGSKKIIHIYSYALKDFENFYDTDYSVDYNITEGKFDLIINNVQPDYAGTYFCVDLHKDEETVEAELTVINATPVCSSNLSLDDSTYGDNNCNVEPDYIEFNCSVGRYYGNYPPVLDWYLNTNISDVISVASKQLNSDRTASRLVLKSSLELDGMNLVCRIRNDFQPPNADQYSCKSTAIRILYSLNSTESPLNFTTQDDHTVICSTKSNYQMRCSYKWISAEDEVHKVEIYGKTFLLTNPKVTANPGTYKCLAECNLNGKSCILSCQVVQLSVARSINHLLLWLIIVSSLLFLSIIGIITSNKIWKYKIKQQKKNNENLIKEKFEFEKYISDIQKKSKADEQVISAKIAKIYKNTTTEKMEEIVGSAVKKQLRLSCSASGMLQDIRVTESDDEAEFNELNLLRSRKTPSKYYSLELLQTTNTSDMSDSDAAGC